MKKKKVFISYRNTIVDGMPENWNLVHQLEAELKSRDPTYEFTALPPEQLPSGTLFSPYDIAEFLCETFDMLDPCDDFILLNKDYFDENGIPTSIWVEAEYYMWSYYGRNMFLGKHNKKHPYYTVITPSATGFEASQLPLYSLSKQQRALLQICSLDFNLSDPWSRRYNMPYRKAMKHLLVICGNCQRIYMADGDRLKKLKNAQSACTCGNSFHFFTQEGRWVCSQDSQLSADKRLDISDALRLLFEKKPVYEMLELTGR